MMTERPTSRVVAPPGGKSSINLGWECDASQTESQVTPRTPKLEARSTTPRVTGTRNACSESWASEASETTSRTSATSSAAYGAGKMAGVASFDPLKNLKSRMSRKMSSASSTTASGSQVYNENFGFGNFSQPVGRMSTRSSSTPSLLSKDDVEGSRPRVWKPARTPQGPPGGIQTFHPAKDGKADALAGRKRFQDMGAGNNRDPNAIEALRFYQEQERLGKQSGPKHEPLADRKARNSHRYYLAAEGKAEQQPGKLRTHSTGSLRRVPGFDDHRKWPVTSAPSECDMPSECDSLPLGAEWSSCRFQNA